ncbi:MAG: lamin tail domain-containing protein [Acidimicrobiales bacterium]
MEPIRGIGLVVATAALASTSMLVGCSLPSIPGVDGGQASGVGDPTARTGASADGASSVQLLRVVDGDSIEVEVDGETVPVRLIGYNAPELFVPAPVQGGGDTRTCNGQAAKDTLAELLGDGPVTLVGDRTDRFGRRLASVTVGDIAVGREMIDRGWGVAIGGGEGRTDGVDASADRDRMKRAAADRRGMWGPRCGEAVQPGPAVEDWEVDPPGPDGERLEAEWIGLVNRFEETIDLDGWVIRDATSSNRFPLRGSLRAGRSLTVRTGSGASTEAVLYLGESFPVWSNDGETVLLVDPAGVVASWAFID